MNFLVVEGHKDAAAAFQREAAVQPGADLNVVEQRTKIRSVIQQGDVSAGKEGEGGSGGWGVGVGGTHVGSDGRTDRWCHHTLPPPSSPPSSSISYTSTIHLQRSS
jgi:hypothetical protein